MNALAPASHVTTAATTNATATDAATGRAVEVVATLGDSVVGVRHVSDPTSGKTRPTTRALLVGGALALASSAIAFGLAARTASDNAAALKRWTASGRPAWSFRPVAAPTGTAPITVAGTGLGLLALTWGLSRRKRERAPSHVRVGDGAGVDFALQGAGSSFDLVAPEGDGFVVNLLAGMDGELVRAGQTLPLSAAGPSVPMTADTRLRVKLGGATFHVQSVPAPRRAATAPIGLDGRVGAFLAASAIAHLGVLALLRTVPAEQETASRDDGSSELIELRGQMASIEERVPETTTTPDGDGGTQDGANAARMALESGTMGSTDARPDPGKRQVKNDGDPSVARHQALQAAREAGILGSSTMRGDLFASIAGNGDLTSGMDALDFDGGWDGTGTGAPQGFGNGPSGFGPGGGGNDWNSVWSGNYNTISRGPNSGDSYSLDGGTGKPGRKHKPTAPAVKFCTTDNSCNVSGEVDPAVIRRYIKRNTAKITYCYERALLGKPGLTGTVQAIFTVAPNGHVLQSSAKGVDPEVSSCVAEVIGNIQFPKFEEAFQVKYDFAMRPTGS